MTKLSLNNLKQNLLFNIKIISSLYFLGDNLSYEFKHKNKFYFENENKLFSFEAKERFNKHIKDIQEILSDNKKNNSNLLIKKIGK